MSNSRPAANQTVQSIKKNQPVKNKYLPMIVVIGIITLVVVVLSFSKIQKPSSDNTTQQTGTIKAKMGHEPSANITSIKFPETISTDTETTVSNTLNRLNQIYQDVPPMDFDAAKSLIHQRKESSTQMANELTAMGDAAVPYILSAYNNAKNGKVKNVLIEALANNKSDSSVLGLDAIVGSETAFSFKEKAMQAITHHGSSKAESVLTDILSNGQDNRLKVMAVRGLSKYPTSLDSVVETIQSNVSDLVRLESVRTVGKIGTDSAFHSLDRIASEHQSTKVRIQAIMELARSFAGKAEPTLTPLIEDADSEISSAAKRAIDMMNRQMQKPTTSLLLPQLDSTARS